MKKSFKTFLKEEQWNGRAKSFYNLYYTEYKPNGVVEKKEKKSEEQKEKEANDYKLLMGNFLRTVSSMN